MANIKSITDDVKNFFQEPIDNLDKLKCKIKDKFIIGILASDNDKTIDSKKSHNSENFQLDQSIKKDDIKVYDLCELYDDVTFVSKNDLDCILQDLNDIKEISAEMGSMLNVQSESIQKIEHNIDETSDNLMKSEKELDKAKRYKVNGIVNLVGGAGGAITGSIFGPIGSVIGAGIGLGSAIVFNFIRKEIV